MGRRHKRRPKCGFNDCPNPPYEKERLCVDHLHSTSKARWAQKNRKHKQHELRTFGNSSTMFRFRRRGHCSKKEVNK